MSMHLEFEPHSWYKGFAIKKWDLSDLTDDDVAQATAWTAYTDNGMTYKLTN